MAWAQLEKFCAVMNIPCPDHKTFKKYEKEVGLAAEKIAKESCREAATKEKLLTLEHAEQIEKSL